MVHGYEPGDGSPTLLGLTVYIPPSGPLDEPFPFACGVGFVGGTVGMDADPRADNVNSDLLTVRWWTRQSLTPKPKMKMVKV